MERAGTDRDGTGVDRASCVVGGVCGAIAELAVEIIAEAPHRACLCEGAGVQTAHAHALPSHAFELGEGRVLESFDAQQASALAHGAEVVHAHIEMGRLIDANRSRLGR